MVLLPDLTDMARYEFRDHPRVEPLLRAAVAEAGLEWLDLIDTFRPYRGREAEIQWSGLRHPNAEGYGMIAAAVADRIETLVPEATRRGASDPGPRTRAP